MIAGITILESCSSIKKTQCSTVRYVPVVFVTDYGTYTARVPFCDTVYIGGKKPDTVYLKVKAK